MKLDALRSLFSVIPQESFIFKGTIEFNISPNGRRKREEIVRLLMRLRVNHIFQSGTESNDSEQDDLKEINIPEITIHVSEEEYRKEVNTGDLRILVS